jgi:hypothetical protein
LNPYCTSEQAAYRLLRLFQKSERAHCAAPPFQIEPASLGFDLVLGAISKEVGFGRGGDRKGLWNIQDGGIKAAEKASRKAEEFCHMTGLLSFFIFPGYKLPTNVLKR